MSRITVIQVLLSITALEFFGPIVRDTGSDHLLHPDWPGHARVHLVWLRPFDVANLRLSAAWQCCNLGGFWVAYALEHRYGGVIAVPGSHIHLFGADENVVVFTVLSFVLAGAIFCLRGAKEAVR